MEWYNWLLWIGGSVVILAGVWLYCLNRANRKAVEYLLKQQKEYEIRDSYDNCINRRSK